MNTAVALVIFNRPDTTERVFAEIAKAKPKKLFVIADGPREGVRGDTEKCALSREVIDRVDWDCEVHKNYSDVNLGCGKRPVTGISWVFEKVDKAIILEDDCRSDSGRSSPHRRVLEAYSGECFDDQRQTNIRTEEYMIGFKSKPGYPGCPTERRTG
jgi:hypothetical protein